MSPERRSSLPSEGEHIGDTAHPKIGIWKHRPEDPQIVQQGVQRLMSMADVATNGQLQDELKRVVPEYTPDPNGSERTLPSVTTTGG